MKILALFIIISCWYIIADSCTCTNIQSVEQYLSDSTTWPYVAEVKILSKVEDGKYNDDLWRYRAQVLSVYNGCLNIGKCPITLETNNESATCGRPLDDSIGKQYVLSFRAGSNPNCKTLMHLVYVITLL